MITMKKAIEILTKWREPETVDDAEQLHEARELGIEAMKRIQRQRKLTIPVNQPLLPGETH
ncbi:hypothetical protein ES703_69285 [subsurface metagenome]